MESNNNTINPSIWPLEYFGYNGFWDGCWRDSMQAVDQLSIADKPMLRARFMKGWNMAQYEQGRGAGNE
jgi:hypothetical protein